MKRRHDAQSLLVHGPIDLVGHGAEPVRTGGYSLLELERAGISLERAEALGLPVDTTRVSGVGANVMRLRTLAQAGNQSD